MIKYEGVISYERWKKSTAIYDKDNSFLKSRHGLTTDEEVENFFETQYNQFVKDTKLR